MDVRDFLGASWRGEGEVLGLSGRVLRRFRCSYDGRWSEDHGAFHLDEVVAYADGRRLDRKWAVSHEGGGAWVGGDDAGGRIRLRSMRGGLRLRFDRSRAVVAFAQRTLSMDLREAAPDRLEGRGAARALGLALVRTRLSLRRRAPPPPSAP